MELRQLEYFVAVAEEANFTRAAARVHVAQPGVSAQIRRLEREFGEPLLDRSGRTVRLTEVGAAVLPYARAALGAVADARLTVDELAGLMRGRVAVGMVIACGALDVPDVLASFHKDHPAVEITLSEANSVDLLDQLRSGRLDLAVVGLAGPPPPGIASQAIVDEAMVAAVAPGDPLSGRTSIPLTALRHRDLVSLPRGTGLRACLDDACATAGIAPRIAFEASDLNVVARLAERGLGVAILPESLARARSHDLHPLTITRPKARSQLALAWRTEGPTSPAARALLTHARTTLPRPSA
jgi:DNA-binding transcriptional LysR family regulator